MKTKIGFQERLLNAGQKYCRMLQREHSAKLSTFIKLQFVINTFVLSIFEWSLKIGFTVFHSFHLVVPLHVSTYIFKEGFKLFIKISLAKFLSTHDVSRVAADIRTCYM